MSVYGYITNIQRCSTEDGPGIRTTAFFKGCPLKCLWCHNIETISPDPELIWHGIRCIGDQACVRTCPEHALELTPEGMKIDRELCTVCGACVEVCPSTALEILGERWNAEDLVEELARDTVFFQTSGGGVTLSGGEPMYQADFAVAVAKGLKEKGIHVALDTCGYYSQSTLESILPHVDLILYDLKVMDGAKHREYTGVPVDRILENAKFIGKSCIPVWIRTPVIPGHTDSEENIRAIAEFIVQFMPNVQRYDLLAFNNLCIEKYALLDKVYPLKDAPLMEKATMEHLANVAREAGVENVQWSGMTQRDDTSVEIPRVEEVRRCG
ncbi:MAG: glycyl-radical enzyme activating protein [Candidatus Thorarchaeota archaeon]|nr:MAG: glycyl-radical enzyme activating protein [Candidatus Thorarchaeota archaeon]